MFSLEFQEEDTITCPYILHCWHAKGCLVRQRTVMDLTSVDTLFLRWLDLSTLLYFRLSAVKCMDRNRTISVTVYVLCRLWRPRYQSLVKSLLPPGRETSFSPLLYTDLLKLYQLLPVFHLLILESTEVQFMNKFPNYMFCLLYIFSLWLSLNPREMRSRERQIDKLCLAGNYKILPA